MLAILITFAVVRRVRNRLDAGERGESAAERMTLEALYQRFSEFSDTGLTIRIADVDDLAVATAVTVTDNPVKALDAVMHVREAPKLFSPVDKQQRIAADQIENELGIATCPVNWPIGSGKEFKGVYDRNTRKVMTFADTLKGTKEGSEKIIDIIFSDTSNESFYSSILHSLLDSFAVFAYVGY